jgi:hypothetical protein
MTLNTIVEFSKKNMEFFILAIYAYVLFQIEDNDYITMLLLTVAACLSICFLKKKNVVEGITCSRGNSGVTEGNVTEGFENPPKIVKQMPDMMGPYDGLCLQTGNNQYWMKSPDETSLVPNDALFTYLSSQGPTKPVFTDNSALTGPSIDGHPDSEKKLFMLANNRTSPNCCPSTFSTSTGCVCTTKNQRDFIASRGAGKAKEEKKEESNQ